MDFRVFNGILKAKYCPYYAFIRSSDYQLLLNNIHLMSFTVKRKSQTQITISKQKTILQKLLELDKIYPYVVGISSYPNDSNALEVASNILFSYYVKKKFCTFKYINVSASYTNKDITDITVLYNITVNSDLKVVRDLIVANNRSLCLVCINEINPVEFFDNYIKHSISGALHILSIDHYGDKNKKVLKNRSEEDAVFSEDLQLLLSNIKSSYRIIV